MSAYPDDVNCPGCGSNREVNQHHELRGEYQQYRCGAEDPKETRGCGALWEYTSTTARERTGVGNTNHAGATRGVMISLNIDEDDWNRIFGTKD